MRNNLLLYFLLLCSLLKAQEVLVPYRVGDNWGLSDFEGKLVVPAKYDKIYLGSDYPKNYFGFKRLDTYGIICNSKELFGSLAYNRFKVITGKYILAAKQDMEGFERKLPEERQKEPQWLTIFGTNGQRILPEDHKSIKEHDLLSKEDKQSFSYLAVFILKDANDKMSLIVYDTQKNKITDWLLKDKLSITTLEKNIYCKTGPDKKEKYVLNVENGKVVLQDQAVVPKKDKVKANYDRDDNSKGTIEETTAKTSGKNSSAGGADPKNGIVSEKKEPVNGYIAPGIKIGEAIVTKGDNGKKGIKLDENHVIYPRYNVLIPLQFNYEGDERINFLVSKKSLYGVIDAFEKEVIPVKYDSIYLHLQNTPSSAKRVLGKNYLVKKDGKYGFVDYNGKEQVPVAFDTIYQSLNKGRAYFSHDDNFVMEYFSVLKKGNKYGTYLDGAFTDALFAMKPKCIVLKYQGKKDVYLIGLADENGDLFCYARADGLLYYKK